ncbi:hypothetical protein GCM10011607_28470 [Shewanella inventionis]|uniref:Conjugal transfer protein TrbC n=1 Tax=Shewanella inventionis TaxID=1738770 RepID=A0ABQ1JG74_9GAMM|nr:hypothetical protein [Shewanella inventionis]GGB66076.1 hypothetical protein GCM10011607_28470 [Shewanella inventionis]
MNKFRKFLSSWMTAGKVKYYTLLAFIMTPNFAHAAEEVGVQKVLKNLMGLFEVGAQALISGSFLIGLGFAAMAFFLFKGAGEPNGQNKGVWFSIVLCAVAAGGLMYLGASAYLFGDTLLGVDGTADSIDKTNYGL